MKMNIEKKYRVIDTVFFEGEIEPLLFRFTELDNTVDFFIVLESLSEDGKSPFENHKEKFESWRDKIIHIKSVIPSQDKIEQLSKNLEFNGNVNSKIIPIKISQTYDLLVCLKSLNLNFDDIIMISNVDEIPELPSMEILQSYLSFEPVVFLQKDFLWSKDFIKQESHVGTFCFQYSHLITNKNISHVFTENTSRNVTQSFTPMNSGFRFESFTDMELSVEYFSKKYGHKDYEKIKSIIQYGRDNLIYYDFETLSNPKSLVKYNGKLPNHIDMIDSQDIGRSNVKKHLVVIGIDSFQNIDADDFDTVSIVSHTTSITSETYKEISSNCKIHYIQIPNKKYYDVLIDNNSLENFQKMYFLNEIKKILFLLYPLDIDIFEFYFAGKTITHSWSEIKDKFIYDLLHN